MQVREGSRDAGFLLGAGLALYAFWATGALLGHGFGALVPDPFHFGLDFLGVAVFLCLLMLFRPGRAQVLPFAATAVALMLVSKNLLASITGATVVVALVRML